MELKKQVEELQARKVPRTPLEEPEERRRATSEADGNITEGQTLYMKAVGVISMIWEALLEDETIENIRESVWQVDERFIATKAEMKKLPFKEKLIKMADIKRLQYEF